MSATAPSGRLVQVLQRCQAQPLSMSGGAGIEEKAFLLLTRSMSGLSGLSDTRLFQNTGPAPPSGSQVTIRKRPWPGCCGDLRKDACLVSTEVPGETSHTVTTDWKVVSVRQEQLSQGPTPEGCPLSYIISFEVHKANIMNKEKQI